MSELRVVVVAAAVSVVVAGAAVATASGPPPPPPDDRLPEVRTIVGHGTGTVEVGKPLRKTDASIERVVAVARRDALPKAVESARADAIRLARAAGMTLGTPMGVEREIAPYGYGDSSEGTNGPGQWCWTSRRGKTRCHVPDTISVRVTLTVAAS
jgi:hypothetical protein